MIAYTVWGQGDYSYEYCDDLIIQTKINNFISGVRILWNTLINDFSQKSSACKTFVEASKVYSISAPTAWILLHQLA